MVGIMIIAKIKRIFKAYYKKLHLSRKISFWGIWKRHPSAILWQLRSFCTPCWAPNSIPKVSYQLLKCDDENSKCACRKSGLETFPHRFGRYGFFWWFLGLWTTLLRWEMLVTNLFPDGPTMHLTFPSYVCKTQTELFKENTMSQYNI